MRNSLSNLTFTLLQFALPTIPAPSRGAPPAGGFAGPDGMSMEGLQQMMAQMQAGGGGGGGGGAGPSGLPTGGMPPGMQQMMAAASAPPPVELSAEEKKWITVYPIYFDAKRRYEKGCRRVAYKEASLWPKSENLVKAASKLTLYHVHEPRKAHPRDWENPGRIKVQLFNEDGKPLHQKYTNKKELLRAIAAAIQPECGGVPPPLPAHPKKKVESKAPPTTDKKVEGKSTNSQQNNKNATAKESKVRHRQPIRIDANERVKASKKSVSCGRLPSFSPIKSAGVLNTDIGSMMGGLQGMGPMGSMLGALGMGGDDDDEEEADAAEEAKKAAEAKKKDPMQQLSRRQRKRVVRIGR